MLMGSAMGWMGTSEGSGGHVTRFLNFFFLFRVANLFSYLYLGDLITWKSLYLFIMVFYFKK